MLLSSLVRLDVQNISEYKEIRIVNLDQFVNNVVFPVFSNVSSDCNLLSVLYNEWSLKNIKALQTQMNVAYKEHVI